MSTSIVRAHARAARPAEPRNVPRYVARCGCDALWTWKRADPSLLLRRPLLCGSWRHDGPCARHSAAVAFARIKEAVERPEFLPAGWVFCVLTLDRDGYYGGKRWRDEREAYSALSKQSRNFLTNLRRLAKKNGWTSPASNWVAVVEAHRSGWPHVNLMFYSPEIADELDGEKLMFGEVLQAARQAGWGVRSTAERVRSRDALAGYFVKLAGTADRTTGEIAKLTQAPLNAAKGFRRLRSGVGFLPPKRKNPDYTGTLLRRDLDPERAAWSAFPLVKIKDPEARAVSARCLPLEEDRIEREYRARQLARISGLDLHHFAPPRLESFRLRNGTYLPDRVGPGLARSRAP